MVATTYSRAQLGLRAPLVTVEAHIGQELPQIVIVGLPEAAVRESKDRVRAAMTNSGFALPDRKATVNLAPADLPKQGGRYDLAIALAILEANQMLPVGSLRELELIGELALDGSIRGVGGVLPAASASVMSGRTLIVPRQNSAEAALALPGNFRVADHLLDVVQSISGVTRLDLPQRMPVEPDLAPERISDIRGQAFAKRALIIAAAGGHNLLFVGPPGAGKTMLASRLSALLPPLSGDEALAVASIHSVSSSGFNTARWGKRPFRRPHHTASSVALVGGGNPPRPGEISLAHYGVLFLDELPEFTSKVLEALRQPLESGEVVISRAHQQATFPSRFQLVAAMNPCPCGFYADGSGRCLCGIERVERYQGKISGPLLDRIDMHVDVPGVPPSLLTAPLMESPTQEHEAAITVVGDARRRMMARAGKLNADLSAQEVAMFCPLEQENRQLIERAMISLGLTSRGYFKILKIARTIADLSGCEHIDRDHLTEALGYRRLDRTMAIHQPRPILPQTP